MILNENEKEKLTRSKSNEQQPKYGILIIQKAVSHKHYKNISVCYKVALHASQSVTLLLQHIPDDKNTPIPVIKLPLIPVDVSLHSW